MRDIKFRAWDKNKKEMARVVSLDFYNHIEDKDVFLEYKNGETSLLFKKDVVLMECTNMRDKYGAKIYVGDICKLSSDVFYSNSYFTVEEGWEMDFVAGFDGCAYLFRGVDDKYMEIYFLEIEFNEIDVQKIGNIYESFEVQE